MALPSPDEVAGPYLQQYDVYYKRLDPEGKDEIPAMAAAGFLKKSGLADDILGKIWEISDYGSKGYLDRSGLFVACKMVALVQCDMPLTVDNARVECKAPNFGAETAPGAPTAAGGAQTSAKLPVKMAINFLVKPEEKRKYDTLFDQLQPEDDKITGDKARNVMMSSKLPTATLGKVWDLSDVDRDGFLDRYEFTVAMHLVFRALQGDKIPDELPDELQPDKVPKPLSALPSLNGTTPKPPGPQASIATSRVEVVPWVVNSGEKLRYNVLFKQTDSDHDGFVSGVEIKNVFLQTGLPQNILAHIWNLCDMNQEGKLNPEQFALAMWLINRKQAGKDPPAALTPDMVPPSLRPKGQDAGTATNVYNNPELEMIAKDIQSLLSEKIQLEKESQNTEYNMSVKKTEQHSLQSEYDTLASTLKQLTNQKDVAQKRLDDLDTQKASLESDSQKLEERIEEENKKIEKLRSQADEQEASLLAQEEEVHGKQKELDRLKAEETELLQDIKTSEKEIDRLEHDLNLAEELKLEALDQTETLTEAEKHMTTAVDQFTVLEAAGDGGDYSSITDTYLEPLRLNLTPPEYSRLEKPVRPPIPEPPVQMNGQASDSEAFGTGVQGKVITPTEVSNSNAEWASSDAFSSAFDAFSNNKLENPPQNENRSPSPVPANPLFKKCSVADMSSNIPGLNSNNDFTDENPPLVPRPDSSLHGQSDSPTPALPPKNNAAPPKRPPPPRRPPPPGSGGKTGPPVPPPPQVGGNDPFSGSASNSGGGFADFAKFDSVDEQFNKFDSVAGLFGGSSSAFHTSSNNTQSPFNAWNTNVTTNVFGSDGDSAIGSSADPTPTHKPAPRYSGLEFNEDPFKDANHRYGDPFDIEGADPFVENNFDPFTANVHDAFGTSSTTSTLRKEKKPLPHEEPSNANAFPAFDAWGDNKFPASFSKPSSDPWGGQSANPTSTNLDDSFDPFSLKNQLKQNNNNKNDFGSDPFSQSNFSANNTKDPFGGSSDAFSNTSDPFSAVKSKPINETWGVNNNKTNNKTNVDFDAVFGPSNFSDNTSKSSPFSSNTQQTTVTKPPPNKSIALHKSETVANVPNSKWSTDTSVSSKSHKNKKGVSQSLSRPWGTPYLDVDSSTSKPHKSHTSKLSHLGDLFTGNQGKHSASGGHSDSNTSGTKDPSSKEKKKKSSYLSPFRPKKQHSFSGVDKSKSAVDLSHMGVATPSAPTQPNANPQMEALHVRMASEASKRAEEDRMRRIQLQEEQDLAYAIALSKAEAVSLKQH